MCLGGAGHAPLAQIWLQSRGAKPVFCIAVRHHLLPRMAHRNLQPVNTATTAMRCLANSTLLIAGALVLPGCTVLAVADLAASAVVGTAGLVVDAAVGTAKIGGKVIGKTADLVLGANEVSAAAD